MPDHAGTERDMLLLDRYGDDIDGGSGDMKKKMLNLVFDSSDDEDMPVHFHHDSTDEASDGGGGGKKSNPKSTTTTTTKSKQKKKTPKSDSVCSRLRPLREIAHCSERDSHGPSRSPTPALILTSSQERAWASRHAACVLYHPNSSAPYLLCPLFPAYSSAP